MSDPMAVEQAPLGLSRSVGAGLQETRSEAMAPLPRAAQYAASLLFVALATGFGFMVEGLIAAPNLTLIFVLPVIAAATSFGWGPALVAVVASVLAFDFFFTEPKFTFVIASPADVWAAALLLAIAAIVSAVAAESRRRALEARQAAEQAQALQTLAHVVIQGRPRPEIVAAAATALNRIFGAPSVVFSHRSGVLRPVASAGGAKITNAESEAAKGALESGLRVRGETYPYVQSAFDFWSIPTSQDWGCVIGVDLTHAARAPKVGAERFVEIVGAYLAVAVGSPGEVPTAETT
jgi:two-component system sensor histidine kinase KdpD